jgi:hypothetical protein
MYILRTWPAHVPEGKHYVVDSLDRVTIQNYDMRFLRDMDDSVILLEWDIAIAYHDLWNFRAHCLAAPHLVHVAPYPLYPESLNEIVAPVWAHRHMVNECPLQLQWVEFGDPVCDIFSTGMVYLPKEIIHRLDESDELVTWHNNINDSKLAFWHYYNIKEKVPIHWDVRPIHLHYDQETFYDGRLGRRIGPRSTSYSNR